MRQNVIYARQTWCTNTKEFQKYDQRFVNSWWKTIIETNSMPPEGWNLYYLDLNPCGDWDSPRHFSEALKYDLRNKGCKMDECYLLLPSLDTISSSPKRSISLLNKLCKSGLKVYIYSIHPTVEFTKYLSTPNTFSGKRTLLTFYRLLESEITKNRRTKYPLELLEYCRQLRACSNPVSLIELSEFTGIPTSTISSYISRNSPPNKTGTRIDSDRLLSTEEKNLLIRIMQGANYSYNSMFNAKLQLLKLKNDINKPE